MEMTKIWQYGEPDEYELEDLTQEKILKVENELAVNLPITYLELLKKKNGGRLYTPMLLDNVFQTDELIGDTEEVQIEYFLGVSDKNCEGILQSKFLIQEWELPNKIVLFSGDGHWWLAFDYRNHNGSNPPIVYLDSDYAMDEIVANSFDELIKKLKPKPTEFYELTIPEIDYSPASIESTFKKGKDIYTITSGFRILSQQGYEINWLVEKLILIAHHSDFLSVFSCEYYLLERLKTVKKSELNIGLMNQLLEKLLTYPSKKNYDINEIVIREARKIQKLFLENLID
ncbi:MAG: SMI1/KNR4 family protein [Turicibacter sp.]|nr:SMI1/KNR4 family protein [Turicibacter sp.]